ncbi:hypothetical protein FOFC_17414 [Fusarium oxysporum]|nr:hypothetical protein FOFC_17414 [Fusarium oxysporum]
MAKNNTEWIISAFESAKVDFTKNLKHPEKYDFTNITSGEDVIKAAKDIEERQTKSRTLSALGRIEPYMKGLEGYAGVIDTFAQAKADILCLIWRYSGFLCHVIKLLRQEEITEDARLITSNASLEHVQATDLLRRNALEEFQKAERFRNDEKFLSLSQALESKTCKSKLGEIINDTRQRGKLGAWLDKNSHFTKWLEVNDSTCRYIWLQGIPGAGDMGKRADVRNCLGKTFLAANLIRRLQAESTAILYGFIDYDNQAMRRPLRLWHSLIFQLVSHNRDLCSIVHEILITKYDSLTSDNEYVEEFFSNLVQSSGPLRIVIDGLDEADETERGAAVDYLLRMTESHPNIKLLLSSRPERDLEIKLKQKFHVIRVDQHNEVDINNYVKIEGDAWLSELQECGADDESCNQIRTALEALVKRANGMFLYAKLVLNIAKSAADLPVILDELETLPTGLDGAYRRILLRLKSLQPRLQQNAKKILMWVATAKYPLRESEVLQAVSVKHGKEDFNSTQRTAWVDIRRACGPIIETTHGVVQFVHFTAKSNLIDREQHLSLHRKPFKCPEKGCLFADLGFSSGQELSRHTKAIHEQITISSDIPSSAFSTLPPGDIFLTLQDTVRDNQVQIARSLLQVAKDEPGFPNNLQILIFLGCAKASRDMLNVLFNAAATIAIPNFDLDEALAVAIDAQNFYSTKFLLQRGADVNREATWPDDKELKFLDAPATYQRSQYLRWRCWKISPINRAFALLHSAILDLLVNSHGADLRVFTGFGYVNTYGMFAYFKDDDPEVTDRLNRLAWLFVDSKLVEAGMKYALEKNSVSVLTFCLARGVYLDEPDKVTEYVLPVFLLNFAAHSSIAKKKSKILSVILKHCESRGLLPDVCRLGIDSRHLVQEAEIYFGVEWEDLVMNAKGGTSD